MTFIFAERAHQGQEGRGAQRTIPTTPLTRPDIMRATSRLVVLATVAVLAVLLGGAAAGTNNWSSAVKHFKDGKSATTAAGTRLSGELSLQAAATAALKMEQENNRKKNSRTSAS
eukprot:m.39106 g.39106  ORF g.39106 m.39106 type:complete len:115 (+) comp5926_c0_seq2:1-345(+)